MPSLLQNADARRRVIHLVWCVVEKAINHRPTGPLELPENLGQVDVGPDVEITA